MEKGSNYPHLTDHVHEYFRAVNERFSSKSVADEEVGSKLARLFVEGTSFEEPGEAAASLQATIAWNEVTPDAILVQKEKLAHRVATQFVIAEEATLPEEVRVVVLKECVQMLRDAHRTTYRVDSPSMEPEFPPPSTMIARDVLRSFMEVDVEKLIAAADLFREERELPAKAQVAINALRAARLISPYKSWRYRQRLRKHTR